MDEVVKPKRSSKPAVASAEEIHQAVEIANALAPLMRQRDAWLALASNPICGKPGFGYKAARKFRRNARQLEQQIAAFDQQIVDFVTVKGPVKVRNMRHRLLRDELKNWEQSNPVMTIDQISQ